MDIRRIQVKLFLVLTIFMFAFVANASADAVIFNTGDEATASVALGVRDYGALNVDDAFLTTQAPEVGLAYKFGPDDWQDATAPGCLCEGWGVSATSGGMDYSGWDNAAAGGPVGLTLDSFTTDAAAGTGSTITSAVHLTSLPGLSVSQTYEAAPNAPGVFFVDHVSITNTTGGVLDDLRYVRVMDWDVPPTEFDEFVTIQGTATTAFLETSHDNGFDTSDPLGFNSPLNPATLDVDFIDDGPADHGAFFKFNFGSLADGETYEFDIFYGAAESEAAALAAIGDESLELYSLGQQSGDPDGGTPATFIFGFAGVGGEPVIPTDPPTGVPEPSTLLLLGFSVTGLGFLARRRRFK